MANGTRSRGVPRSSPLMIGKSGEWGVHIGGIVNLRIKAVIYPSLVQNCVIILSTLEFNINWAFV